LSSILTRATIRNEMSEAEAHELVGTATERAGGHAPPPNRRARARAAMRAEIKETALELMRDQGSPDVRFADIARAMGLTAPALYRYYANRDELLTDLIADAFDDLAAHLATAAGAVPAADLGARMFATCRAYRSWASAEPLRFALVFGVPVPGYTAVEHGPTTEAAVRAMTNLSNLVTAAAERGVLRPPLIRDVGEDFGCAIPEKMAKLRAEIPPDTYQAMLHAWAALHGFTCLEAYGHLHWLTEQARDDLFASQIRLAAVAAGLPEPHRPPD
jgi:AcrR family transcriptional regulator